MAEIEFLDRLSYSKTDIAAYLKAEIVGKFIEFTSWLWTLRETLMIPESFSPTATSLGSTWIHGPVTKALHPWMLSFYTWGGMTTTVLMRPSLLNKGPAVLYLWVPRTADTPALKYPPVSTPPCLTRFHRSNCQHLSLTSYPLMLEERRPQRTTANHQWVGIEMELCSSA